MATHIITLTHNGKESYFDNIYTPENKSDVEIMEIFKNVSGVQDLNHYRTYRSEVGYATYYPRIGRRYFNKFTGSSKLASGPFYAPLENLSEAVPYDRSSLASSLNQLSIFIKELEDIFRNIEPTEQNMNAFGHRTRNMLLIAAMEFENECRGILRANDPSAVHERLNTNDFVRVHTPLRLSEYSVSLPFYPSILARRPFDGWDPNYPTQSLSWYAGYNAVKHDRETNFSQATLDNAIDAISACVIILAAQYRVIDTWGDQIGEFFRIESSPSWSIAESYISPEEPNTWTQELYHF